MRCGVRAVLRILFCAVLCWEVLRVLDFGVGLGRCCVFWMVFGIVAWDLGGALCVGLYLGFRCGNWEVLCVLDCIWDFGFGFGRCFVYCGFGKVDFLGGLRNGVTV